MLFMLSFAFIKSYTDPSGLIESADVRSKMSKIPDVAGAQISSTD